LEALVKRLPGEHIVINAEVDGTFPNHHADPTVEENLQQLKDVVASEGCDLGLAFDGDGDRIGAVDSQGRVVWGDQMLAIMAGELLKELPGAPIIADVKASQSLFDRVAELGGKPIMWKTGHSLIKAKMVELDAPLAGEMSGHIFYKHKFYGHDDALYAGIRFLNAITSQGGSLDSLKDDLPQAINTPELRFDCDETRKFVVVEEVKATLQAAGAEMSTVDGVRVQTKDGWWLLRASNTQAVLVARCEASTEEGLTRLKQALIKALGEVGVEAPADL
ncbi:MAG: phosphomannomutase/phosphoglucomutase, partial [Kordiimonadaceae bacterium]|nr:phosphomannomutase/phosphoglucomutase [Kordiimonadaceae bacterium]